MAWASERMPQALPRVCAQKLNTPLEKMQVAFQLAIFCAISMNTGEGRQRNATRPTAG